MIWRYAVIAVAGYLLGNISMGIIVASRYKMDIRNYGSGNAGTTNVLRTLGWLPSAATLVGDALKSFAAASLGWWLAGDPGLLVGGLCAVVGHNWPVFNGFRGGKGMACALGMVCALNWPVALGLLADGLRVARVHRHLGAVPGRHRLHLPRERQLLGVPKLRDRARRDHDLQPPLEH